MKDVKIRVVNYLTNAQVNYKKVADVYETSNYNDFTTFKSNREPDHIGRIESNIQDKGYISNPIQVTIDPVTGKLIIIDGNNRMHALQELGLPISFVILDGATESDMVALNLVSKNWQKINYIRFYATKGIQSYVTFLSFINEYPDFKVATMEYILKLSCENDCYGNNPGHRGNGHKLERGFFEIRDAVRSREILDFCMKVKSIASPDIVYNQNCFVLAVMRLFRFSFFEPEEMLMKMNSHKRLILKQPDIKGYAKMMEDIINCNRRGDKVHFDI